MSARLLDNRLGNLFAAVSGIGNQHAARPVDPLIAPGVAHLIAFRPMPDHRRLPAHGARFEAVQFLEQGNRFGHRQRSCNPPVARLNFVNRLWNYRKFSGHFIRSVLTFSIILSMARAGVYPLLMLWIAGMAAAQTSGFVGSNACRICHADVWFNFNRNPHFKSIASGKEPPERTGCEGCHGPAKAHVEARGGKATIPHAFSLMSTTQVLEDCLSCHARDFSRANIRRSQHTLNDVACTSCHSVHHSATPKYLLAKQQRELCYGCHATVRAQFEMPAKHRVNEGFMQCSDCHNPHGAFAPTWSMGQRPRMIEQTVTNEEACLKCHTDKRGPFVYEHPPVRIEGCETCHYPYRSE